MNPASQYLLGFIPLPNLPGDQLNYHASTVAHSSSDSLSLRFTQNLSPTVPQNGRGSGRRSRRRLCGGRGGFGGRGGQGGRGTNIVLQGQLQYRRTENEALNVFPGLGSTNTNTSVTVPLSLNIVHNRTVNNFSVNIAHSRNESTNAFANVQNVGGLAGINYPTAASTDPAELGRAAPVVHGLHRRVRRAGHVTHGHANHHELLLVAPVREEPASDRRRLSPRSQHERAQHERARRVHVHAGSTRRAASRSPMRPASNAAFADFLLGIPQQAALQVGGTTQLRGRSFDAYIEDNWQKSSKLTFNLGLRYELVMPYTDANGLLANLDAAPGFTSVAPVLAGGDRTVHGSVPRRA